MHGFSGFFGNLNIKVMLRYCGENLGHTPHIVVLGSCKVGNFVVSTPLLKAIKARFPKSVVGFIGSVVTADLELSCPSIDWRISWDDPSQGAGFELMKTLFEHCSNYGDVQLAINLDGFNPVTCILTSWLCPAFVAGNSFASNLRKYLPLGELPQQKLLGDLDWDSLDFWSRYSGFLRSNYISELFCHFSFLADHVDPTDISIAVAEPPFPVPDILIHCTASRAAKMWPTESWRQVILYCENINLSIGIIGSSPRSQKALYNSDGGEELLINSTSLIDLRGKTSLLQLAGACRQARAVISVDAGPLHIAAAVGTPTLAIVGNDFNAVGASPIRLWLPRVNNISRTVSSVTCSSCSDNFFRNDECIIDGHPCMMGVDVQQVLNWLSSTLAGLNLNN